MLRRTAKPSCLDHISFLHGDRDCCLRERAALPPGLSGSHGACPVVSHYTRTIEEIPAITLLFMIVRVTCGERSRPRNLEEFYASLYTYVTKWAFYPHAQEYCSGRTYDKRIAEAILPEPLLLQTSLFIPAIRPLPNPRPIRAQASLIS